MNANDKLAIGRMVVRKQAPYMSTVVMMLAPTPMAGLGTMGVSARGALVYDPEWVAKLPQAELAGVLVHECLHLLHGHHKRLVPPAYDARLANVAKDLAINDAVLAMGFELPKDGMFAAAFGFEAGLVAEEYYGLLLSLAGPPPPCTGPGAGKCGSCAGEELGGEPGDDDPDARSDADVERAAKVVAEEVRQHSAKHPGTVPGMLDVWAGKLLSPPKVRWQDKLRRYARSRVAAAQAGMADYTYRRPNRRFAWDPAAPIRPSLAGAPPRVALVVDTSGSMLGGALEAAVSEARGVLAACGAGVTFVAADAVVQGSVSDVRTVRELLGKLKGGGGTDFRPAFDALLARRQRPDVVIFATDGYGPAPEKEPIPTIWLLIGKDPPKPAEWGAYVVVDDAGEAD